jgi:uncharacterized protein DUF11
MKRIIVSLALAVGLVLPSMTAAQPPAAHASAFCDVFGEGFPGCGVLHGVPTLYCSGDNIVANGTEQVHGYRFQLGCSNGQDFGSVSASFDSNKHVALEQMTINGQKQQGVWVCTFDPWINAQPDCYEAITHGDGPATPDYAHPDDPSSAAYLDNRSDFAAALKKATTPAPSGSAPLGTIRDRGTEVLPKGSNSPTQPNLSLTVAGKTSLFNGMTAPYTITIKNQGAPLSDNPVVQLAIAFNGNLQYYSTVDTGAFTCTPGATINCTGHLDSSGQATLTFQGYAKAAGSGEVQATVDPSQALSDSNYGNNTQSLKVTIS